MRDRIKNIVEKTIKRLKEESSTGTGGATSIPGNGIQHANKYSFKKGTNSKGVKNPYYYKLGFTKVPDKIKDSDLEVKQLFEKETLPEEFQKERMAAFDQIEKELNLLSPMLSNAKNKTKLFYTTNPGSEEIIISTDLILESINDIKTLLKGEE